MVVSLDGELVPSKSQGVVDLARFSAHEQLVLRQGEVLIVPQSRPQEPAAVMAHMYVPLDRSHIWPQITSYRRWTQFFPNITHSEVLESVKTAGQRYRRLYQVGRKGFMMMTAQVEIYLQVFETACEHVQFRLEQGTFSYFDADLHLQDMGEGTLLTYRVQAAPTIPVPTFLIEQGMKIDLPGNMRQMRQVLCQGYGVG
ncbi:cyclase [Leptolyngbya sp. BL0902]|uniref:SRPBCC family protein n=1 Tax=Leptolyngbya sp. BL0902 TaxID=1115757 RepID=UPI0018E6EDEE|nr:SRPBCC family protein [Leptolyngbya sp. BL0902]QQE64019.1 cyclase [Leptolyngbya sp. BL0902]